MGSMFHAGNASNPGTRERERVRRHLAGAEHMARRRRPRLHPVIARNRALLLDELARYRAGGRFPRNTLWRTRRVPRFVDEHGTPCAVAHLLQVSGQRQLVRHVARSQNAAHIRELARLPELRAWLAAAGLSLDEAARIQPAYGCYTEAELCFCQATKRQGLAIGTVLRVEERTAVLRVERVEGVVPGWRVGDERELELTSQKQLGEQVLLEFGSDLGTSSGVEFQSFRFSGGVQLQGDVSVCHVSRDTERRPIATDTVLELLMSSPDACLAQLESMDDDWMNEACIGGGDVVLEDSGCNLGADASAPYAGELTSVGLLLAVLAYRRRRSVGGG